MIKFKCALCRSELEADCSDVNRLVECPLCHCIQAIPDFPLSIGQDFHGYKIKSIMPSDFMWDRYKIEYVIESRREDGLLYIPTSFFINNVTDINTFSEYNIKCGSLNIQNIPALLHYNTEPGKLFFVYEYFKGGQTLGSLIKDRKLPIRNSLMIIKNIALSLSDAWIKDDITHANLNPNNIQLTGAKNKISLDNFGLSNYLINDRNLLENGFNIWDIRYMSPEFIREGLTQAPSGDIYSLGCILFLLITGKHPFESKEANHILSSPPPDPRDHIEILSVPLVGLVQQMIAKNTSIRLSNWKEVCSKIDALLAEETFIDVMTGTGLNAVVWGKYGKAIPKDHTPSGRSSPGNIDSAPEQLIELRHSMQTAGISHPPLAEHAKKQMVQTINRHWHHQYEKSWIKTLFMIIVPLFILLGLFASVLYYHAKHQNKTFLTKSPEIPAISNNQDYIECVKNIESLINNEDYDYAEEMIKICQKKHPSQKVDLRDKIITHFYTEKIEKTVNKLIAENNYPQAIEFLSDYSGKYSDDTSKLRGKLLDNVKFRNINYHVIRFLNECRYKSALEFVENNTPEEPGKLRSKCKMLRSKLEEKRQDIIGKLAPFCRTLSENITNRKYTLVKSELAIAYNNPEFKSARNYLDIMLKNIIVFDNFQQLIVNKLSRSIGKKLTISLVNGVKIDDSTVKDVKNNIVYISGKQTESPTSFHVDQINLESKLDFINSLSLIDPSFAMGLVCLKAGDIRKAKSFFAKIPLDIGLPIIRQLDQDVDY